MGVGLPGSAANEFPPGCYLPAPKLFWRRRFAGVWVRVWTVNNRGTGLPHLCSSMDSRRDQPARSVDDCQLFGFPWRMFDGECPINFSLSLWFSSDAALPP